MTLKIQGDRVSIREATDSDVSDLAALFAEESVAEFWGAEHSEEFVRSEILGDDDQTAMVVYLDGRFAGFVQFGEEETPNFRHASIDLAIATEFQNRGIGREVVYEVARYLIEERGHHRLTIDPRASNTRAVAAYEAIGFKPIGILRQYDRNLEGVWCDGLFMDLLAPELTKPTHP